MPGNNESGGNEGNIREKIFKSLKKVLKWQQKNSLKVAKDYLIKMPESVSTPIEVDKCSIFG